MIGSLTGIPLWPDYADRRSERARPWPQDDIAGRSLIAPKRIKSVRSQDQFVPGSDRPTGHANRFRQCSWQRPGSQTSTAMQVSEGHPPRKRCSATVFYAAASAGSDTTPFLWQRHHRHSPPTRSDKPIDTSTSFFFTASASALSLAGPASRQSGMRDRASPPGAVL